MKRSILTISLVMAAAPAWAQPIDPPFLYALDSACDDLDDEQHLAAGLIAARVSSDVAAGYLASSPAFEAVVAGYLTAYDLCVDGEQSLEKALLEPGADPGAATSTKSALLATLRERSGGFQGLLGAPSGVDVAQDDLIRGVFGNLLVTMRNAAPYLRRVQPVRLALFKRLDEILQRSIDCRTLTKTSVDASVCLRSVSTLLADVDLAMRPLITSYTAMADGRGRIIDASLSQRRIDIDQVATLMSASQQTRALIDGDLWPKLLDLHAQAQSWSWWRQYNWNMGNYYWSVGDQSTAYVYWWWFGYCDHALAVLTQQLIPSLEGHIKALQDQAYAMDGEVLRLQDEVRALEQRASNEKRRLFTGLR